MTFDVVVVGCGHRASTYAAHFVTLGIRVAACADIHGGRLRSFSDAWGVPVERRYTDALALLRARHASNLLLLTSDDAHASLLLAALALDASLDAQPYAPASGDAAAAAAAYRPQTGAEAPSPSAGRGAAPPYNILCEKPLCTKAPDLAAISAALTSLDRRGGSGGGGRGIFAVCHVLRYSPLYHRVHSLVSSGALGEVLSIEHTEPVGHAHFAHSYVRGNWAREVDSAFVLLTKCCHDIDLLHWLVTSSPPSAAAAATVAAAAVAAAVAARTAVDTDDKSADDARSRPTLPRDAASASDALGTAAAQSAAARGQTAQLRRAGTDTAAGVGGVIDVGGSSNSGDAIGESRDKANGLGDGDGDDDGDGDGRGVQWRVEKVSSCGTLSHFHPGAKPAAAGRATHCADCAVAWSCPYSALRIYGRGPASPTSTTPPSASITSESTSSQAAIGGVGAGLGAALSAGLGSRREGFRSALDIEDAASIARYTRCVYEAGNDVCTDQSCLWEYAYEPAAVRAEHIADGVGTARDARGGGTDGDAKAAVAIAGPDDRHGRQQQGALEGRRGEHEHEHDGKRSAPERDRESEVAGRSGNLRVTKRVLVNMHMAGTSLSECVRRTVVHGSHGELVVSVPHPAYPSHHSGPALEPAASVRSGMAHDSGSVAQQRRRGDELQLKIEPAAAASIVWHDFVSGTSRLVPTGGDSAPTRNPTDGGGGDRADRDGGDGGHGDDGGHGGDGGGHGGGDAGLLRAFMSACTDLATARARARVSARASAAIGSTAAVDVGAIERRRLGCTYREAIEAHGLVFTLERARLEERVIRPHKLH